jgi:hypothetical protein
VIFKEDAIYLATIRTMHSIQFLRKSQLCRQMMLLLLTLEAGAVPVVFAENIIPRIPVPGTL